MQKIVPAILVKDVQKFEQYIHSVQNISPWMHIDIMDGDFVDNKTIALEEVVFDEKISVEVHLMVSNPVEYFTQCEEKNIKRVIIHYEAVHDLAQCIKEAQKYSFDLSVALNPDTEVVVLSEYINNIQGVLLMSVFPGYGGQQFIPDVLKKVTELRALRRDIIVGIDGGIKLDILQGVCAAEIDYACINSGLFSYENIQEQYKKLTGAFSC